MSAGERSAIDSRAPHVATAGQRHQGIALAVIAAAQFMLVLDGTIMNIALPSVQRALDISASGLAWVVTAYALTFGGLLLLGGRAGDLFGRRRVFRLGLVVFTVASLIGGLAVNDVMLIAARATQGVGAAIAAPTALSLISTTFPPAARGKAMGVYGAMSGLGSTAGLLLGGVLTEYVSWRWVLFVNVPLAIAVLFGTPHLIEGGRRTGRLDIPGAITGTLGATSLVYAIVNAGEDGWTDRTTVLCFVAAAVLIVVFLVIQSRAANPMLPLGVLKDRNRAGANITMLLIGAGMFATYYFLTLYMQQVLGYTAMQTGLAYLPFAAGILISSGVLAPRLLTVAPVRVITGVGLAIAALGMLWLHTLTPDSTYVTRLMPAMFVTAIGLGSTFVPMTITAVGGVPDDEAGIAAGVMNTAQQVGGAIGLAVLTGVAASAANGRLASASASFFQAITTQDAGLLARAREALTHGYTTAFVGVVVLYLAALAAAVIAVNAGRMAPPPRPEETDESVPAR
ncbi:MFS transporter [Salinispora vitiensis]|uniref:MFS transporter n=1 Tax=Salinispora vitiensis TaxID=999544 RepID=UPI00035CF8B9|nr:MFS transporter [Salinispora vitiensis]